MGRQRCCVTAMGRQLYGEAAVWDGSAMGRQLYGAAVLWGGNAVE